MWLADGTAASSWFSVLGETVNVKDFGAKGDGATNNPGGAVTMTNMLGGKRDQMITLRFEDNNPTVQNTVNLRLAGAASKTFKILDTLTLLNVDGATRVEVCRSIN